MVGCSNRTAHTCKNSARVTYSGKHKITNDQDYVDNDNLYDFESCAR